MARVFTVRPPLTGRNRARPFRCFDGWARRSAPLARLGLSLFLLSPGLFLLLHGLLLSPGLLGNDERPPIALLGALDAEVQPVLAAVSDREPSSVLGLPCTSGRLDGRPVVVAATGVGKVNAAMSTALLVERFGPSAVVFTGVAGALDPELQPGDVVIGEALVQHDLVNHTEEGALARGVRSPRTGAMGPVALEPDPRLLALARERAPAALGRLARVEGTRRPPRIVFGTIATGDSFVGSRAKKEELRERHSARAVEMEGAAVAQACRELGVPVLVVRGLSDGAGIGAREEARRNLAAAAGNAAEVALAVARALGPKMDAP